MGKYLRCPGPAVASMGGEVALSQASLSWGRACHLSWVAVLWVDLGVTEFHWSAQPQKGVWGKRE